MGPQRQPGMFSASAPMAGYPKIYKIEMDPHEDLIVAAMFGWGSGPTLKTVEDYMATLRKYPNTPHANITQFRSGITPHRYVTTGKLAHGRRPPRRTWRLQAIV